MTMNGFWGALTDPAVPFLRYALLAGLLSSAAFGVIGTYVVVRRISYIAGSISHAALAGIGAALYFRETYQISWLSPLAGAVVSSCFAALVIAMASLYAKQREDTVIGTIWAVGMAVGIVFIARTPGYVDPMSYLFGNILLIDKTDLLLIAMVDGVVVALGTLFYHQFLAVSFDEEYSRVQGLRTGAYHVLLVMLTALTVVLMVSTVGIVLVIALLTIPPATASLFAKKMWQMMAISALLCALFTATGLFVSYGADLPAGAVSILVAGLAYLATLGVTLSLRALRR